MKILYVSIYPEKGRKHTNVSGVASYTKNLILNLPRTDKDEIFVLCNKINKQCSFYLEDGVRVIRCFDRNPKFFWQIFKEIYHIKPDIIHFQQEIALFGNMLTAYILQWLLFFLRGYNPVITLHGVVSLKKINKNFVRENNSTIPAWIVKVGLYIIYKPICIWPKKIIVHEEIFKNILTQEYNINSKKIAVISHGVEDLHATGKAEACKKLSLNPNKHLVLFMGYLTGYKGIDLLLDGFALYAKLDADAYLVVCSGKHPKLKNDMEYNIEYTRLQKKAANIISKNQYRWDGFIEENSIVDYYSACDVSVYPYTVSMSSSGPMAIAIGFEKPFLASDVFRGVIFDELLFERREQMMVVKLQEFFENKNIFFNKIKVMKSSRIWSSVASKTMDVYKKK